MTNQDYMNGPDIKAQCKLAIKILTKDNSALELAKESVECFVNDTKLQATSFDALKKQLNDYSAVISGLKTANQMDIIDWNSFCERVDDKVYIGKNILSNMESYEKSKIDAEERAEDHRSERDDTWNPFMKAYYQWLIWDDEDDISTYKSLYDNEKAKEDRFDEIEANTCNLFKYSDDVRRYAKIGLTYLGKRFQGGQYNTNLPEYTDWKQMIIKNKMNYSEQTYIGISDGYLPIIEDYDLKGNPIYSYGGSQMWFSSTAYGDGSALDEAIMNSGCGIIALINFFYYMEGTTNIKREDYMKRVREFVEAHPGIKDNILNKHTGIDTVGAPWSNDDLQNILKDYVKKHTDYSSAKWQVFSSNYLERIEEQVSNGIPVILQLGLGGSAEPDVIFYNKTGQGFVADKYNNAVNDHYVTVTGIQKVIDDSTGKLKTYLEITSWGTKYYIDYDEFLAFKEAGYEGGPISDLENNGYTNISVVK